MSAPAPAAASFGGAADLGVDKSSPQTHAHSGRGFINVDIQMRTNVPHIFAIGEVALAIEMGVDAVDIGQTIENSGLVLDVIP